MKVINYMKDTNNVDDTITEHGIKQTPTTIIQDVLRSHSGAITNDIQRSHESENEFVQFPGISEILPSLYLSGAGVAIPLYLKKLKINCVINAAPELPDTPLPDTNPIYLQIPIFDKCDANLEQHFNETADLIEQINLVNGRCLVHCVAGVSRSASLCIAYLMKYKKMNLKSAYEHVKIRRQQIRPNIGFIRQLMNYENSLYGTQSVSMVYYESLGQEIPDIYEPEYRATEMFYQQRRNFRRR